MTRARERPSSLGFFESQVTKYQTRSMQSFIEITKLGTKVILIEYSTNAI